MSVNGDSVLTWPVSAVVLRPGSSMQDAYMALYGMRGLWPSTQDSILASRERMLHSTQAKAPAIRGPDCHVELQILPLDFEPLKENVLFPQGMQSSVMRCSAFDISWRIAASEQSMFRVCCRWVER